MKIFIIASILILSAPIAWGASLLKDEQKSCKDVGGEMLANAPGFEISRAFCNGRWVLWLAKGSDSSGFVIIDKISLRALTQHEKIDDSFYCYLHGGKNGRLIFYGIFDFDKTGTVLKGKGKLVEAYLPDVKKQKLLAMPDATLNKVVCEPESDD